MARSSNLERLLVNDQVTKPGSYNNSVSKLTSTSVTGAIDELHNFINSEITGGVTYKGGFTPSTNTPTLQVNQSNQPGTLFTNSGSITITGTNTSFTNLEVGDKLKVGPLGSIVTVASIQDDTSITVEEDQFQFDNLEYSLLEGTKSLKSGDMYVVTSSGTFFGESITKGDSLFAIIDYPVSLEDWTIVEGNIENGADISYDGNAVSGLSSNNIQDAIDEVASFAGRQPNSVTEYINNTGATITYTLTSNSTIYQHIEAPNEVTVVFPNTANDKDLRFLVKNDEDSIENVVIQIAGKDDVVLTPGEMFEAKKGDTKWMII